MEALECSHERDQRDQREVSGKPYLEAPHPVPLKRRAVRPIRHRNPVGGNGAEHEADGHSFHSGWGPGDCVLHLPDAARRRRVPGGTSDSAPRGSRRAVHQSRAGRTGCGSEEGACPAARRRSTGLRADDPHGPGRERGSPSAEPLQAVPEAGPGDEPARPAASHSAVRTHGEARESEGRRERWARARPRRQGQGEQEEKEKGKDKDDEAMTTKTKTSGAATASAVRIQPWRECSREGSARSRWR